MKAISKICIALMVLVGFALAGIPHIVENYFIVPGTSANLADYPFDAYDIHNMGSPNDYIDETEPTVIFFAAPPLAYCAWNSGNFLEHDWVDGDTCCVIGSYEEDGAEATHTGYYRLFSQALDAGVSTETWMPWDTLHVMEPADVSSSRRTLNVEITNPYETDHQPWGTRPYDVLGFWVVADTTATGTPAAYDVDLGFVPVNGVGGGITTFTYDTDARYYTGFAKSTYHSYYIVARPETTATPGVIPGFSTRCMAANSNLYTFGVEESDNAEYVIPLAAAPNPFTQNATISYSIAQSSPVKLTIYNTAGQLIQTLLNETKPAGNHSIRFDGASLPSGVYFYRLETADRSITNTFTKVK